MKGRWIFWMILLALLLNAACTPTTEQPTAEQPITEQPTADQEPEGEEFTPEPEPTEPVSGRELTDIEWLLVGYGSQDAPTEPLPGSSVTLSFGDGELGGSAGCNHYFGDLAIDGATIEVGMLGSTMMWCENFMEQESAFLELLGGAQTFAWEPENGRLTIEAKGGTLLFQELEPPPDQPLIGTVWQLDSIGSGGAVQSTLVGSKVTIEFADGRASGSTGCNSFGADYTLEGEVLSLGAMAVTLQDCGGELMVQESTFLAALGAAESLTLAGETLLIGTAEGELIFKAATGLPLEGTIWVLEGISQGEAIVQTWVDVDISAEFAEGQVSGSAGCNHYFASYELDGTALTFGPIGRTEMACMEEGRMEREDEFLAALEGVTAYFVKMDRLTLTDAAGQPLLVFAAQEAAP